ncbi:MAG: hypothetical protein J6S19_05770, partial [Lentisphaeria bacterium]|nr:hypothetical protein [Lentisphaeria bacterium]
MTPADVQTRFKISHDNRNLFLAVEAYDDMSKIVCKNYPQDHRRRTHNDYITIDFDTEGNNMTTGKIIVDANGGVTDFWGEDDNTGTGRIIYSPHWNSSVKIISAKKYADHWTVEMSIPLGVFFQGNKNLDKLRFNVGRERPKAKELSSYAKIEKFSFSASRYYPELKLKNFDIDPFKWLIASLKVDTSRKDGVSKASVSCKLWNQSKKWAVGQCQITLQDAKNQKYVRSVGVQADKMRSFNISEVFSDVAPGKCSLEVALLDTCGNLIAAENSQLELDFQPVRIRVLQPSYRDNIYFTQKLNKIKAEIQLIDNIGKPLTVTLAGANNFSKTIELPAARESNIVEFDFPANMPAGDYVLKVGECSKVIRKLPKAADEVRLDEKNITYVNGEIFMPVGYFHINPDGKAPGMNMMAYFRDVWRDGAEIKRYLDRLAAAGSRGVIYPYIEPSGAKKVFAASARQGDKLTDEQKRLIREAVEACRNNPGLLAYFAGDEPEGHGHSEEWYEALYKYISELDPYHPILMCNYG